MGCVAVAGLVEGVDASPRTIEPRRELGAVLGAGPFKKLEAALSLPVHRTSIGQPIRVRCCLGQQHVQLHAKMPMERQLRVSQPRLHQAAAEPWTIGFWTERKAHSPT